MNPVKNPLAIWQQNNSSARGNNAAPTANYKTVQLQQPVPWSSLGYYLEQRPSFTFDPLFHAGCYYVQEASSMFLEQALKQLVALSQPLNILDLSAAPGGKSTHIQSLLSADSLLVSNEVIKNRCQVLVDNITKWGAANVVVTNNDPAAFKLLNGFFDVVVVDAPCSGSGLFRKDAAAINEWSQNNVTLCSRRQQRILADVLPSLKQGGVLIYATCSYSPEENELIADWLVNTMRLSTEKLNINSSWGIVETRSEYANAFAYRFYPHLVNGEGFFMACFRKTAAEKQCNIKPSRVETATVQEARVIDQFVTATGAVFLKQRNHLIALPETQLKNYGVLQQVLNVQYGGTAVGQVLKQKLVPAHALALSNFLNLKAAPVSLSYEEAIRYLQRQNVTLPATDAGWQAVSFLEHRLGWINVLPNRINNYYPKELRILKQSV